MEECLDLGLDSRVAHICILISMQPYGYVYLARVPVPCEQLYVSSVGHRRIAVEKIEVVGGDGFFPSGCGLPIVSVDELLLILFILEYTLVSLELIEGLIEAFADCAVDCHPQNRM